MAQNYDRRCRPFRMLLGDITALSMPRRVERRPRYKQGCELLPTDVRQHHAALQRKRASQEQRGVAAHHNEQLDSDYERNTRQVAAQRQRQSELFEQARER